MSTNIAETSLTIPDVAYVIDSGIYNNVHINEDGVQVCHPEMISQTSARQRAGRAGRTGPGATHRLYTEQQFREMLEESVPEICSVDLKHVALVSKMLDLHWARPPPRAKFELAEDWCVQAGFLDKITNTLLPRGVNVLRIGLSPQFAGCFLDLVALNSATPYLPALLLADSGDEIFVDIDEERLVERHQGMDDLHTIYLILNEALQTVESVLNEDDKKDTLLRFANEHGYNFRTLGMLVKKYPKMARMIRGEQKLNHNLLMKHFDVARYSCTSITHDGEKQHTYVTSSGVSAVLKQNSSLQLEPPGQVLYMTIRSNYKSATGYELCMPVKVPQLPRKDMATQTESLSPTNTVSTQTDVFAMQSTPVLHLPPPPPVDPVPVVPKQVIMNSSWAAPSAFQSNSVGMHSTPVWHVPPPPPADAVPVVPKQALMNASWAAPSAFESNSVDPYAYRPAINTIGVELRVWPGSGLYSPFCTLCNAWCGQEHFESSKHKKRVSHC